MRFRKLIAIGMCILCAGGSLSGCTPAQSAQSALSAQSADTQDTEEADGEDTGAATTKAENADLPRLSRMVNSTMQDFDDYIGQADMDDPDAFVGQVDAFLAEMKRQKDKAQGYTHLTDNVRDAGQAYYDELDAAVSDMRDLLVFVLKMGEVLDDLYAAEEEIDSAANGDIDAYAEAYGAVYREASAIIRDSTCPPYLASQVAHLSQVIDNYGTVFDTVGMASGIEDSLRVYSAIYLGGRLGSELGKYIDEMLEMCDRELDITMERMAYAQTIAEEIKSLTTMSAREVRRHVFAYTTDTGKVSLETSATGIVYPSLYNSMDAIVIVNARCTRGSRKILVEAEIPGFTQKHSSTYTITEQLTPIYIKPPVAKDIMDMSSANQTQISLTVKTMEGELLEERSFPVKLMSKHDFLLWDDVYGLSTRDNFLSFMTPEATAITDLKRHAVDALMEVSDGAFDSFPGYQAVLGQDAAELVTYLQAASLVVAMADMGVKYTVGAFSASGEDYLQRVMLPTDVLTRKSGLCIETALVVASALQSAGMHAMLIFPPGHAQVAVETWQNSGDYFLIETTALSSDWTPVMDYASEMDSRSGLLEIASGGSFVVKLSAEEWDAYIGQDPSTEADDCYVLDCDNAALLGLSPFNR